MIDEQTMRHSQPGTISMVGIAVTLLSCCCCARADDQDSEPSATPYRPTVSNPADLPVPGWLEGEFGGLHTAGEDHSRADSVPWLLKYAFDENHGLLLGGNAYMSAQPAGASKQSSFGDTFLEWKQRFPVSDKAAFGIEAGVVAPTASHDLGIGKAQWEANGIFSSDLGAMHIDLNLGEARGGEQPVNVSPWQTTWAAAVSTSLTGDWGTAFELSGMHQRGLATQSQALVAFSYNVSHRLVLDAGGACGLTHAAHDRSLFAGATILIGRLR
ncbi:MAG TPA: hypothetical protein VGH81_01680 [Rudaea sp.]|jgi:hypothetical protein